jgi:predicted nuclease with TOPRIM domain
MEARKHLSELHQEHLTWIKSLEFYKDELQTLNNRLGELVTANSDNAIRAQIEHFQNQFIRQNEVIDELKHDIKASENEIIANISNNPVASDHRSAPDHTELRDRFETFEKIYSELKNEFQAFASKTY